MSKILKTAILGFILLFFASPVLAQGPGVFDDAGAVTIVIDPGHGGDDTGAQGPSGTDEKDVTLSIALKLAEELREKLGAIVLLTRDADVFVPLEERTAFANARMADIFISIHANAAVNRDARGIETFFLNMDSTDEDARRLAAFENSADSAGGDTAAEGGDDLRDILVDMASTSSHHESSRLAEAVHMSMLGKTGREGRGVKQAPFVVLIGATMPAILVEVGFIANPTEERLLSSRKEQSLAAGAIADGVASFRDLTAKRRSFIEVSGKTIEK